MSLSCHIEPNLTELSNTTKLHFNCLPLSCRLDRVIRLPLLEHAVRVPCLLSQHPLSATASSQHPPSATVVVVPRPDVGYSGCCPNTRPQLQCCRTSLGYSSARLQLLQDRAIEAIRHDTALWLEYNSMARVQLYG